MPRCTATPSARHGVATGQALSTLDVTRRSHYRKPTFQHPCPAPVWGGAGGQRERHTVATTEIRFGDNDRGGLLLRRPPGARYARRLCAVLLSNTRMSRGEGSPDQTRPGTTEHLGDLSWSLTIFFFGYSNALWDTRPSAPGGRCVLCTHSGGATGRGSIVGQPDDVVREVQAAVGMETGSTGYCWRGPRGRGRRRGLLFGEEVKKSPRR